MNGKARLLAFLAVGATLAVLAACGGGGPRLTFTHGVASGDVTPDSAILWTRVDKQGQVTAQVATEPLAPWYPSEQPPQGAVRSTTRLSEGAGIGS